MLRRKRFSGKNGCWTSLLAELLLQGRDLVVRVVALGAEVELDLGLGAGRADGHDVAGRVEELQHVGGRLARLLRLEVVDHLRERRAAELFRRVAAQVHQFRLPYLVLLAKLQI